MAKQLPFTFELCAQTLSACLAANAGGAHRIELCTSLEVGGLTPPLSLVESVVRKSAIPVHVLLRPFDDQYRTSTVVLAALTSSLHDVRSAGAAGVVLGLLRADGTVDTDHTRALVELTAPLPVTFHRAFDATPDLSQALEDVISTGCTRILTSGGQPNVLTGAPMLARLIRQAGARIEIAIGGGLRLGNAQTVAHLTAGDHFHGSLLEGHSPRDKHSEPTPELVQQMLRLLTAARMQFDSRSPAS